MTSRDQYDERLETPPWAQTIVFCAWFCLTLLLWIMTVGLFSAAIQHPSAGLLASQFSSGFSDAVGGLLCGVLAVGSTVVGIIMR